MLAAQAGDKEAWGKVYDLYAGDIETGKTKFYIRNAISYQYQENIKDILENEKDKAVDSAIRHYQRDSASFSYLVKTRIQSYLHRKYIRIRSQEVRELRLDKQNTNTHFGGEGEDSREELHSTVTDHWNSQASEDLDSTITLSECLERLGPRQHYILENKDIYGFSGKELASMIGVTEGYISQLYTEAVQILYNCMEEG